MASVVNVGSEILVNTFASGEQGRAQITALSNGGFVVTWEDYTQSGAFPVGTAARAQIFTSTGEAVGSEIQLNKPDQLAGHDYTPQIISLSNGSFVVAWTDQSGSSPDSSGTSIAARVFASDGTLVGSEIFVNTSALYNQRWQQITALSDGGFVVTWYEHPLNNVTDRYYNVRAQVFGATGSAVGQEILVSAADSSSSPHDPQITSLSNGGFVVAWSVNTDGYLDVHSQVFAANGVRLGAEVIVNTTTIDQQDAQEIVSLTNGGFVVVWHEVNLHGGPQALRAQVFSADGTPVGQEINVNTTGDVLPHNHQVVALANGGFVVTWDERAPGNGDSEIFARIFDENGSALSPQFQVNTSAFSTQSNPHIAALGGGGFVIAWYDFSQSGADASSWAVRAQVFGADGARIDSEILVNTNTNGSQFVSDITAMPGGGFAVTWQGEGDGRFSAVRAQVFDLDAAKPHKTTLEAATHITDASHSWASSLGETAGPVTFGFRTSGATYQVAGHDISDFSAFSATQEGAARAAMKLWGELAGITFVDLGQSNSATILFQNYRDPNDNAGAFAFRPVVGSVDEEGDIFINLDHNLSIVSSGSAEWLTILHEVGHALGLAHPGSYDAMPGQALTYEDDAEYVEDTLQFTVMSYFDASETGANYGGTYNLAPGLHDIAAIQRLYGENTQTRSGSSVYGFHSNVGGVYSLISDNQPAVFAVWDAGGEDTFDFSGYSQDQVINLADDSFSSVGGLTSNIAIARNTLIENAIGGSANDAIFGNGEANHLRGGRGSDTLLGGGANDRLDGGSRVIVDYSSPALAGNFTGDGGQDLLRFTGGVTVVSASYSSSLRGWDVWSSGATANDRVADFNADGRDDLIQYYGGTTYVALSSGTGFGSWRTWNTGGTASDRIADFNGDDRADLIQYYNGTTYVALSTGSTFGNWGVWNSGGTASDRVSDFNGDGSADLIQYYNGNTYVALSTGAAFSSWHVWNAGGTASDRIADFSGDGRADLIQFYNGTTYVALANNTATGFDAWRVWNNGGTPSDRIADFNGDGRNDLIQIYNGRTYVALADNTSTAFGTWNVWNSGVTVNDQLVDMNADGRADVLQYYSGRAYVALSNGTAFNAFDVWGSNSTSGGLDDTLTGGIGADTFVFGPFFGNDVITDFQHGTDTMEFDRALYTNFAAVQNDFSQVGTDVLISFDENNTVLVRNVTMGTLTSSDFIFV